MSNCKLLDLSGFMFSGKAAVSDLISEFEGVSVPNYREEFDLIRIPGGLADLMRAFESGSLVAIDHALRTYMRLVDSIAVPASGWRKLFSFGGNYEERFPGFRRLAYDFIDSTIDDRWDIRWPYETRFLSPLQIFRLKVSARLHREQSWPVVNFHLGNRYLFYPAVRSYLARLLCGDGNNSAQWHVTHNALEPHRPSQFFPLFERIKVIVVDRDVRDIYMTANTYSEGFNDRVDMYRRIAGAHDTQTFIRRQRAMRRLGREEHPDILYINFEDLIEDYDNSVERILQFIGLQKTAHLRPQSHFNPEHSQKNMRLWKNADEKQLKAIRTLEKELPELCRH